MELPRQTRQPRHPREHSTLNTSPDTRPRLLLSSTGDYPFVRDDAAVLRRHVDLDLYIGSGVGGAWQNFRRAMRSDVSMSWLGSVYTAFMVAGARLRGRGSIVMLGGVDVANEPEIGYGIWRTRWKGRLLGWALRNADRVFVVDGSMIEQLERSSGRRWEGITPLPTGYDTTYWTPDGAKERRVLCVAPCNAVKRPEVKGLDLLLAAARHLSDVPFTIIGPSPDVIDELRAAAPPNVEISPPIPRESLREIYRRARVYAQPSRREGLPNALCEAMLCGCVPVGTRVNGIPTAIGDAGYLVAAEDAEGLIEALARALDAPESEGERARARIVENFPRERRERDLVATIMELSRASAGR